MHFPQTSKFNHLELEDRILKLWEDKSIFLKLIRKNEKGERWSFLDGPVTANNPLGVHHGWGRTYKDVFQRFHAMLGHCQRYQNGFDCHGLWIEVEVEKQYNLKNKTQIHDHGIKSFINQCRTRVTNFASVITKQSHRLGQWMDWSKTYYTMSDNNIQHIWAFLKLCDKKGLLIKGNRVLPWCYRCGTSLSQHEMTDSYKEITSPSVIVALPLLNTEQTESLLVWTTTPWTIPANVAVAVHPELTYCQIKDKPNDPFYWIAESRLAEVFPNEALHIRGKTVKGSELVGLEYSAPFDLELNNFWSDKSHKVVPWTQISQEEGTGLVHIAPGCGIEDHQLGQELGLKSISPVDESGNYNVNMGWLSDKHCLTIQPEIIFWLTNKKFIYQSKDYQHRYPHCWRCNTKLIFRLCEEWFIKTDTLRPALQQAAKTIKWIPDSSGQLMQNWLQVMGDWCISRRRFWGLPLPIWECENCKNTTVIGCIEELRFKSVKRQLPTNFDLHRPEIDDIRIECDHCKSPNTRRVEAVGDCWLDAGIVPFSTLNYIDKKGHWLSIPQWKQKLEQDSWFPFDFATEMREQVRLWFYSCLFMSVVLEGKSPFKTIMTYEDMRNEAGEPFHKSKGNAPQLDAVINKHGADSLRWAYCQAPLTQPFRFGEKALQEVQRKLLTLWNCYNYFAGFANIDQPKLVDCNLAKSNIDVWILARLQETIHCCRISLDEYQIASAVKSLEEFIDDLSTWYIRIKRPVFSLKGMDEEKESSYAVLFACLKTITALLAPIVPFMAEELYQNLVITVYESAPESIHLCAYPKVQYKLCNTEIIFDMKIVREAVSLGLAIRDEHKIKVRQPLAWARIIHRSTLGQDALKRNCALIAQELNLEKVFFNYDIDLTTSVKHKSSANMEVHLETELSPDLLERGMVRDFIRHIQKLRKEAGLTPKDEISIFIGDEPDMVTLLYKYSTVITGKTGAVGICSSPSLTVQNGAIKLGDVELPVVINTEPEIYAS